MKVKELIELLKKMPQDLKVWIDAEEQYESPKGVAYWEKPVAASTNPKEPCIMIEIE